MKNVLIIGAGPAGLTAAYDLKKQMKDAVHVTIVEESDAIGGISKTLCHNGNRMDLGGHRFFSKSRRVNEVWEELMPLQGAPSKDDILLDRKITLAPNGPDPEQTDRAMLLRTRVSRIFFLHKFFDYPISIKLQTFVNMGLWRTIKAGFGYLWSCLFKKPVTSLENFYINRFGRPLYQMFFEDYTQKLWGVHPSKIAPDWGGQRVKELSLSKAILSAITKPFRKEDSEVITSLIEQFSYPKYGPGQFWETMAAETQKMGAELFMHMRAVRMERAKDGAITAVICKDQEGKEVRFACDAVFSSMPIKDLFAALPDMPEEESRLANELPYRDFMTVGLLVDKLLLRNETTYKTLGNIVPDCWIYIQERDVQIGRLQIFNNWSPYMVADPEHTVWIGLEYFCNEGDAMWTMSDQDFIELATKELEHIGVIAPGAVRDSVRVRVKKAYPAYFGSYAHMDKIRACLDAIPNLYCIGRNGQHRYNNMDHSMLTAFEASRMFREGDPGRDALWNINTEEAYHEEGKKDATDQ